MDFGGPFVRATKILEGDGLPVLKTAELFEELTVHLKSCSFYNTKAIIKQIGADEKVKIDEIKASFQPAITYFNSKVPNLPFYKAARLFHPGKVFFSISFTGGALKIKIK